MTSPTHDPRELSDLPVRRRRRWPALQCAVVAVALAFPAAAQDSAAQRPLRIAVVDLERVFLQSPPGQKLRDELKQLEERTRVALEKQVKEMEELQRSMEGKPLEEQRTLARRREDQELALRRTRDDAQRQAAKLEADRRVEIEQQLQPIFAKIQEEQDFDLILNKAAGLVVFVKDSIEITDDVLAKVGTGS
jgi:Skp family chaperone for outer membrane proteins